MSDLKELYQEILLDHNKKPRNFSAMDAPTNSIEGYNPLCGDQLIVYVKIRDSIIDDIRFTGSGCAISIASASMMTEAIKGKTIQEAETIFQTVHQMLTAKLSDFSQLSSLSDLASLSGICEYPLRIKCATLAWHTMKSAIQGENDPISTE